MKKQAYFSGPADYDRKRPYCVVTPSGSSVAYDIHSRWSSLYAAQHACCRSCVGSSVLTITQVKKANAIACDAECARTLSYSDN